MTNKLYFSCIYVSCTHVEDFTVWCLLILTNLVFIEFLFSGPGFQIYFDCNTILTVCYVPDYFRVRLGTENTCLMEMHKQYL